MRFKYSTWRVTAATVLSAAMAVTALPAQAVTPASSTAADAPTRSLEFSDRDVVDFLVFARGPIAESRPDLIEQMNLTIVEDAPAGVTDQLLSDIRSADPDFHDRVTKRAQAEDPYEAEASLQAFAEDLDAVASKYQVNPNGLARSARAAGGSIYAFSNYVVSTQVAVAAALAVSVLGVVAALVVFAYQRPADSSEMARERYASDWATLSVS